MIHHLYEFPFLLLQQQLYVQNLFFLFTMDCFSSIAFGEECDTLGAKEVAFARAFDSCQNNMVLRIFTPYWKLLRLLGLQGEGQIKKDLVAIDQHVERSIQQSTQTPFAFKTRRALMH